jgi:hypothetical protein
MLRYRVQLCYTDHPRFWPDCMFQDGSLDAAKLYLEKTCNRILEVKSGRILDAWDHDKVVYEW